MLRANRQTTTYANGQDALIELARQLQVEAKYIIGTVLEKGTPVCYADAHDYLLDVMDSLLVISDNIRQSSEANPNETFRR